MWQTVRSIYRDVIRSGSAAIATENLGDDREVEVLLPVDSGSRTFTIERE